jgi:guanylate kinase
MLLKEFPNLALSVSTTTRPIRPAEKNGVHYYFVSPDEFQKKIDNHEFAEWAEVHGNRYGTSKAAIEKLFSLGKHVLFAIDVQGAMSLAKLYPTRTVLIFLHPPSMKVLEERLRQRPGESAASIEKRLRNAYNELEWSKKFRFQVVNDKLDRAFEELKAIIRKECP